jgi:hypothetical protein
MGYIFYVDQIGLGRLIAVFFITALVNFLSFYKTVYLGIILFDLVHFFNHFVFFLTNIEIF